MIAQQKGSTNVATTKKSASTATPPPPSGAFESITPDIARAMLEHNKRNRSLIASRLATYVEAMKRGEWRQTHQGIGFGADGTLHDGQHRLLAIVQANVPVTMFVVRGLPANAREAIDTGGGRSAIDNLAIVEGVVLHRTMGAALNVIWMATVAKSLTRNATTIELRDTMLKHLSGVEAAKKLFPRSTRGICRSGFVAAFVYAYPTAPEKIAAAATTFYDGANLQHGDPMYTLRGYALRKGTGRHERGDAVDDFRRALGMIAAELDGEKRQRVFVKDTDIDNSRIVARFAAAHAK